MATKPNTETTIARPTRQLCKRYEHAIQLLGKRWTGLILDTLMEGPQRFCEMTATVEGLSDRVLSDRLRELESEGVIERTVYKTVTVTLPAAVAGGLAWPGQRIGRLEREASDLQKWVRANAGLLTVAGITGLLIRARPRSVCFPARGPGSLTCHR